MINISNKKILLIAPKFFDYEKIIFNKLKEYGANVYLIYENLEEINLKYRFVYVYASKQKSRIIKKYYEKMFKRLPEEIDIIFVIRGSSVSDSAMQYLHTKYSSAYFIMYQWDSISNNPNAMIIAKYFDKKMTFDLEDAKRNSWDYRPLFFSEQKFMKKDIDIAFICSIHSERIQILNKLKKISEEYNLKLFTYVYSKPIIFFKRKYLDKLSEYKNSKNSDIKFKSLKPNTLFDIYARSMIVVDYTNPKQKGYTMRTIECLGNGCKLITNNKEIQFADFYSKNNISIYEGTNIEIRKDFISKPFININSKILEYYSLNGWINSIFSL